MVVKMNNGTIKVVNMTFTHVLYCIYYKQVKYIKLFETITKLFMN